MRFLRTAVACLFFSPAVLAQAPQTVPGAKVELRLVTLNDADFAKFTAEYPTFIEKGVPTKSAQILTRDELEKLLVRLQSPRINTMQSPAVTVGDKRTAAVTCGDTVYFTTDFVEKKVDGQSIFLPKNEAVFAGLTATICPTVAVDRHRVSVELDLHEWSHLKSIITFARKAANGPLFANDVESPQIEHLARTLLDELGFERAE